MRCKEESSGPTSLRGHYRGWWTVQRVVPEVIRDAKVYRISQDRVVGLDLFGREFTLARLYGSIELY